MLGTADPCFPAPVGQQKQLVLRGDRGASGDGRVETPRSHSVLLETQLGMIALRDDPN